MASVNVPLNHLFIFIGEKLSHLVSKVVRFFRSFYDFWKTVVEDKPITPLPTNPTTAHIISHNEKKTKQPKAKSLI